MELPFLEYLSKINGVGGEIKNIPEDFIVEEIDLEGNIYEVNTPVKPKWLKEENYTVFVLQKRQWNTLQALKAICGVLRISKKRISSAGSKDRQALTTQLVSLYKIKPEQLREIKIKDIEILGEWYWDRPIKMGDLLGNKFKIKIKYTDKEDKEEKDNGDLNEKKKRIYEIYKDLNGVIPNYFGKQRFGLRWNSHLVGKFILQGKFEDAVMEYLTRISPNEDEEIKTARLELQKTRDFKKALKVFPFHLKYERIILDHLVKNSKDFVGAIRKLPRSLALMFVHAYQASLFNKYLSKKIEEESLFKIEEGEYKCGMNWYSFPDINRINGKFPVGKLIGYDTKLNEEEKQMLDEDGISSNNFKIKSIPELSCRGGYRPYIVPLKDFECNSTEDNGLNFSFELPSGSYATVALREFLDSK